MAGHTKAKPEDESDGPDHERKHVSLYSLSGGLAAPFSPKMLACPAVTMMPTPWPSLTDKTRNWPADKAAQEPRQSPIAALYESIDAFAAACMAGVGSDDRCKGYRAGKASQRERCAVGASGGAGP